MIEKDPTKRISALDALQDPWFKYNTEKSKNDKVLDKNVLKNIKNLKKTDNLKKLLFLLL